jgi:protein-S-isoprenylcysteine O-methyltransferase Ste14
VSAEPRADAHGADVRLPPPLLYAVPLLVGWLVNRAAPLTIPGRPAITWAGSLLVFAGFGTSGWGALTFRRHHTTVIPNHVVSTVVTTGPYRFSRNPMYVGMSLAYAGASLLIASWWPLFVLPLIVVAVDRLVIAREERYLRSRFGAAYDQFCAQVRRW